MENKTAKQKESVVDFMTNAVGNTDLKIVRAQAMGQMSKGRQLEAEKLKLGFRWMSKGNTSKLVHPNRFLECSNDGWKFNNQSK